jgi:signal transduction histidine kinase
MARATTLVSILLWHAAAIGLAQSAGEDLLSYRPVSLVEASARVQPDFRPKLLGEAVKVQGIVQAVPLEAPEAVYLAIVDAQAKTSGLMLVFSGDNEAKRPLATDFPVGSLVEVYGTVSLHAGQAVVKPTELRLLGKASLPSPPRLSPRAAASFQYSGMLVEIEGEVAEYREAPKGDLLDFTDGVQSVRVFLPLLQRSIERPLSAYHKGDRIRVVGLVSQFCLRPPYNQFFQLLVANPKQIQLVEPRATVPPQLVPAAVVLILLGILGAWYLQQRSRQQNRLIQKMLQASEEMFGVATAREVAEILRSRMLELIPGDSASVYHYDPARKILERIPDQQSSTQHTFHIEECASSIERAIALSIRNKTVLQFADTNSVDILQAKGEASYSLLVIPMRSRVEARGAIVVQGGTGKQLLVEALHPAAQHLASDACQYLEWLEQIALREQHHRSEKLAVAGQLIHGVITELNAPLERIRDLTGALGSEESAAIHAQVKKASETVRRIVAVARAEQIDARPVDLRFLFQKLMEALDDELRQAKIESEINLGSESLYVLGSQDQLSRVFENLFLHAKAASIHSLEHVFNLNLNRIGRSAMIEVEFSGPFGEGEGPDFSGSALGLAIIRGLVQSYGGDAKFTTLRTGRYRYDIELPSLSASPTEDFDSALKFAPQRGMITALLVEPEMQSQRKMLSIFGELNHRLIPVTNVDEAVDLAEKVRFDVVFSSARPDGGTWAELFHRVHHRTPHFALLSESAEEQSVELLEGVSSSMLRKPVEEADILKLLEQLQQRG